MTKLCVISPKCSSTSGRWLAKQLEADYDNPWKSDKYDFSKYDKLINFGISADGLYYKSIINPTQKVALAVDKLKTFKVLEGKVVTVPWTCEVQTMREWLKAKNKIVGRTTTTGSKSNGCHIFEKEDQVNLEDYILFTGYVHHKNEFRLNVVNNKLLSVLRKITNANNEFEFETMKQTPKMMEQLQPMVEAVTKYMGLTFFGLDVLEAKNGTYFLVEVNSAPMLFGGSGVKFAQAVKELV